MSSAGADIQGLHLFGRWRFNADIGELFDGETTTHLEPQVGKLLVYFLSHQNVLTSRDELITAVWAGRIVSDDAINRCVSILRQILSHGDKNAYIETVVRRGFISHFPPAPEVAGEKPTQSRRGKYQTALGLLLLAVLVLYFITTRVTDAPSMTPVALPSQIPVLAVLPFTTTDIDGDSEFFANGMHDDLLTQLAQLQSIRVISRTSVLGYQGSDLNILEIGKELGADAILEGGIQRNGEQIRINAQLIDAHSDEHLWAGQFDRQLLPANLFEVQTEIAQAIAAALHTVLSEHDATQLAVLPTQNMAAYRAYHQSMALRDTVGVDDPAYLEALERAVALDPNYVRPWAELAGYLSFGNFSVQNDESIQRVEEILEHIRTIAPQSAEYLVAQAYYNYYILRNYNQAVLLAAYAHDLRPSDPRILELKGMIQRRQGDYDGRIESIRQARSLDPRNSHWTSNLVLNLMFAHRYEAASLEIANADFQNFELAYFDGLLQISKHQDLEIWGETLTKIEREYDTTAEVTMRWDAYIASRDFVAAEVWLDGLSLHEKAENLNYRWSDTVFESMEIHQLMIYWFLQDRDHLGPLQAKGRAALEQHLDAYDSTGQYLAMAFITATEGDLKETERLIRNWQREAQKDWAEYTIQRHFSCRALGIAAAAESAVNCIRKSLIEPSLMMPFIEPFLPYYDPIRDEPVFVDLLEELKG